MDPVSSSDHPGTQLNSTRPVKQNVTGRKASLEKPGRHRLNHKILSLPSLVIRHVYIMYLPPPRQATLRRTGRHFQGSLAKTAGQEANCEHTSEGHRWKSVRRNT